MTWPAELHYAEDDHRVCSYNAISKWLLTGTTSEGEQVRMHACGLLDPADDERVRAGLLRDDP